MAREVHLPTGRAGCGIDRRQGTENCLRCRAARGRHVDGFLWSGKYRSRRTGAPFISKVVVLVKCAKKVMFQDHDAAEKAGRMVLRGHL